MVEVLLLIFGLVSEIIGTIAGFGSSTVFLPLALSILDFNNALVLVTFLHIFGNLGRVAFFKQGIDKKILVMFGLPSVIFTIIGALLINRIPQNFLDLLLGLSLFSFAFLFLLKPNLKIKANKRNSLIGGGLSGFFAGLIGTGGALRGAFLTAFNIKKEKYLATAALIALIVDFARIQIYFSDNLLSPSYYYLIPILFVLAIVGSFIGKKIIEKMPQDKFKQIVLIFIALAGVRFIYEGLVTL